MNTTPKTKLRLLAISLALASAHTASAASATWNGTTDSLWSDETNWSTSPVPGTGDTATFNNAGNANVVLNLGSGVTVSSLVFDTSSVAAYTIGSGAVGSQTLTLNNSGSVSMASAVAEDQLVNAALVLGPDRTAATYTLTNSTTGLDSMALTFAGDISGGTVSGTAGTKTLSVNSSSTSGIVVSGSVSNGGASSVALTKIGTGLLTLGGDNTYTGTTSVQKGTLTIASGGSISPVTGAALTVGGAIGTGSAPILNYNSTELSRFGAIRVGDGADGSGNATLNQSAGTINGTALTLNNGFTGQGAGDINLTGGTMAISGVTVLSNQVSGDNIWSTLTVGSGAEFSTATLNLTGTPIAGRNAAGRVTQNGGTVTVTGNLNLARTTAGNAAARRGEYNLNGGTLSANAITHTSGPDNDTFGTFTFNGGTLSPRANNSSFWVANARTTAQINNGGAKIDTAGFNITIAQQLIDFTGATTATLTKQGLGTLTLSGANTFTGATTVEAGKLLIASGGSLADTASISVFGSATVENANGGVINRNLTLHEGAALTTSSAGSSFAPVSSITVVGDLSDGFSGIALTAAAGSGLVKNNATLFLNLSNVMAGSYGLSAGSGFSGSIGASFYNGVQMSSTGTGYTLTSGGFNIDYENDTNLLIISAIPEPSSAALLISGFAFTIMGLRRRRRTV